MKLDALPKEFLIEIFKSSLVHPKGLNAIRYRAKHHEQLDLIDTLESAGYIEKRDDNYCVKLWAIILLSDSVSEAETLFEVCERLFQILRQFYLDHPAEKISLNRLSEIAGMPRRDINIYFIYMIEASLFSTYTSNFYAIEDAYVTPDEKILRYQSFKEVVEEICLRRSKSVHKISAPELKSDKNSDRIADFRFLLHPEIKDHALQQFEDGHLRDAVLNSIIAVFDLIRKKTGLKLDGDNLIGKAFSLEDPYLVLSELNAESGRNDQKGFMQIYKGSFQGIRNPKAHSLTNDLTKLKAAQYLVFASLLARRIDEAAVIKTELT